MSQEYPVLKGVSFHMFLMPLTLIITISLLIDQVYKLKRVENKHVDIELDVKTTKQVVLYVMVLFDLFVLLSVIGSMALINIFYLINIGIWNYLIYRWYKFREGFNKDYFFYKGYIYDCDDIETCIASEKDINITLINRVFFIEIEKSISFHSSLEDNLKLQKLLGAHKVLLSKTNNH